MVLIYCIGRTVRVTTVSYAAALSRGLCDKCNLPFSLRVTIRSAVLVYSISLSLMLSFNIDSISFTFRPLENLVSSRQAWWFIYWSVGEEGIRCVFLKPYWAMEADDIFKASHVSKRVSFTWAGMNLSILCFLKVDFDCVDYPPPNWPCM